MAINWIGFKYLAAPTLLISDLGEYLGEQIGNEVTDDNGVPTLTKVEADLKEAAATGKAAVANAPNVAAKVDKVIDNASSVVMWASIAAVAVAGVVGVVYLSHTYGPMLKKGK